MRGIVPRAQLVLILIMVLGFLLSQVTELHLGHAAFGGFLNKRPITPREIFRGGWEWVLLLLVAHGHAMFPAGHELRFRFAGGRGFAAA